MKRKFLLTVFVLTLALLTVNASRESNEIKRMGIFISNFTELGLFEIDIDSIEDTDLILFGIGHNVINNPKSTVKKCTLPNCEYGPSLMSASSVAESVKKYFDVEVKHKSVIGHIPDAIYDGNSYHFDAKEWKDDTIYYAEVQEVNSKRGIVEMSGELYNIKKKSDRPAYFTATAKKYKWKGKNTWSILSLSVEWKDN